MIETRGVIATLATRVATLFAKTLDLVVMPPPNEIPTFEIALAWHEHNHHDPAQRWFRDQLVANVI